MTAQGHPIELVPGEILDGKYRVERLLGVGGMGAVYVAERLPLQDKVAIKSILSSQNTELNRARFLREARAAASVRHPNVVKIFDFGEPSGRPPYMVMEHLAGPTLAAVIRDYAPLPLARALWIFSGICAAVEAGHRRGVVHRDLKPGNVILARGDDDRETVKVLDFGLARIVQENEISVLTNPGTMLGTCSYMAPELIEANLSSKASDIYALGVVLYEMVTGRSPFRAENNAATIWKITTGDYERPGDLEPDLPQEVCAAIEAALAHGLENRPSSPEELAARVGAPLAASASNPESPTNISYSTRESDTNQESASVSLVSESSGTVALRINQSGGPSLTLAASDIATSDVHQEIDLERTLTQDDPEDEARGSADAFVGRAEELDVLRREYRMALDSRGRLVVVQGDAGVGKSRLLSTFADWAHHQGATVLPGRFFSYEGDQPPPYDTFHWMLGTTEAALESRRTSIPTAPIAPIEAGIIQDKWRVFSRLTRDFSERARGRPLVLVMDDLQWGTALDLEFLSYIPQAIDTPVMIVGTAGGEGSGEGEGELGAWLARLGGQRSLSLLRLGGFTIGEVRAWFQACYPGIRVRPQDLRRLAHATAGNPYYLTEVVGQLRQRSQITRGADGYACAPLDSVVLPATVHGVVLARLEGLRPQLRRALQTACIIGEEFRFDVLQASLDLDEATLEAVMEEAITRNLLSERCRSPQSDYRFETTTLRRVLYDGLGRRKRRRLHRTVVDALLRTHGEANADRIARLLCYHYHAVEDHEATLRWGLRAATETLAHYDNDQAETCLKRAQHAATSLAANKEPIAAADIIALDRLSGLLYVRIGRLEEADEVLERALLACLEHPDDEAAAGQQLQVMLILAGCQLGRGLLEMSIDLGQTAIELAEETGDRPLELEARLRTARAAAAHGQLDAAALLIEPMLEACGGEDLTAVRALATAELASILARQGAFDRAHTLALQAGTLARSCADLQAEYRSVSALGQTHLEGSDLDTAHEHIVAALDMARRLSLRRREGFELQQLAVCLLRRGELQAAEAHAREALAIFLEIRDLASEGDCRVNLGRILNATQRFEEGIALLDSGRELCATVGRRVYEGIALLELGLAKTHNQELDEAREDLRRASALFSEIDSLHLWRSEVALAQLALAENDRPKAATHARRASQLVDILRSRLGHALNTQAFGRSVADVRDVLDAVMR